MALIAPSSAFLRVLVRVVFPAVWDRTATGSVCPHVPQLVRVGLSAPRFSLEQALDLFV
jgi:hypothetical protein